MTEKIRIKNMNMHNFLLSILAGICIGVGGLVFLSVGGPIGAILFSFGLSCVIVFKMKLFTGMAGIVKSNRKDILNLLIALLGNIIGCFIIAQLIATKSLLPIQESALAIANARMTAGFIRCFFLAIGCGFIVDVSVRAAKENKWIVLVFGIPTFILCGFPHCIADAFYIYCLPTEYLLENSMIIFINYVFIVLGNFVGCNLYRIFNAFASTDK